MKILFRYSRQEEGVQLYLSSFTLTNLAQLFVQGQKIKISKFYARDFCRQYFLEDVVERITTLDELHKFVRELAEPVLDVAEFTTRRRDVRVALHDTVSTEHSGEFFVTQFEWADAQQLPPLFSKIVTTFFPIDVSNVLIENFGKYVFVDYDEDNFRIFENYEAYLEAPESGR